jgi:hypothetical protein
MQAGRALTQTGGAGRCLRARMRGILCAVCACVRARIKWHGARAWLAGPFVDLLGR